MQFLFTILILIFLPILATSMTNVKSEKDPQHHQKIENLEVEKIMEKSTDGILAKIDRFIKNGGYLDTDAGRGKEMLEDLCALRTVDENSKDLNKDESKGIFKIDANHQIRIEHGQIDDQLNGEINMKLAEICGPNVSKQLLQELPKYITRIINENRGAISGHFEQVKIVYEDGNGKEMKTLGLEAIMAKGMLKSPNKFSQVFEHLRQMLLSIAKEIEDENDDNDNILKQMITNLTTKEWPPMPSEMWKICTALWEDFHSSHHNNGELGPQKVGETNKAKNAVFNKNKSFPPPAHPSYHSMKGITTYGRRRKRALNLSAQQRKQLINVLVSVIVLMPYIFSIGAAASSSFKLFVSMSLWPFLTLPRFLGRLMATGNNLVFLMFIAFNMYAFHQYGSFPSSPDQGGIISSSSLEMGMQMEPEKAEKVMERLGGN